MKELGPEMMNKVDDQALDVGTILILIGHDHDSSVSQSLDRFVLLAELQPLMRNNAQSIQQTLAKKTRGVR
jgi:hypothetical protein